MPTNPTTCQTGSRSLDLIGSGSLMDCWTNGLSDYIGLKDYRTDGLRVGVRGPIWPVSPTLVRCIIRWNAKSYVSVFEVRSANDVVDQTVVDLGSCLWLLCRRRRRRLPSTVRWRRFAHRPRRRCLPPTPWNLVSTPWPFPGRVDTVQTGPGHADVVFSGECLAVSHANSSESLGRLDFSTDAVTLTFFVNRTLKGVYYNNLLLSLLTT